MEYTAPFRATGKQEKHPINGTPPTILKKHCIVLKIIYNNIFSDLSTTIIWSNAGQKLINHLEDVIGHAVRKQLKANFHKFYIVFTRDNM